MRFQAGWFSLYRNLDAAHCGALLSARQYIHAGQFAEITHRAGPDVYLGVFSPLDSLER